MPRVPNATEQANRNVRYAPYTRVRAAYIGREEENAVEPLDPNRFKNLQFEMMVILDEVTENGRQIKTKLVENLDKAMNSLQNGDHQAQYLFQWTRSLANGLSLCKQFQRQKILYFLYELAREVNKYAPQGSWLMRFLKEYYPLVASKYCSFVIPEAGNLQNSIEDDGILMPQWLFWFFKNLSQSDWEKLFITSSQDLIDSIETFAKHYFLTKTEVTYICQLFLLKIDFTRTRLLLESETGGEQQLRAFVTRETERFNAFTYFLPPTWIFPRMNEHFKKWRTEYQAKLLANNSANRDLQLIENMVKYSIACGAHNTGVLITCERSVNFDQLYACMIKDYPSAQISQNDLVTLSQLLQIANDYQETHAPPNPQQ